MPHIHQTTGLLDSFHSTRAGPSLHVLDLLACERGSANPWSVRITNISGSTCTTDQSNHEQARIDLWCSTQRSHNLALRAQNSFDDPKPSCHYP